MSNNQKTERGDVYQLGKHRLMCGDSTNHEDVAKLMGANARIVFDHFGSNGTTLMMHDQLNHICYMMEINPEYVDLIIERWEEATGKTAVKL